MTYTRETLSRMLLAKLQGQTPNAEPHPNVTCKNDWPNCDLRGVTRCKGGHWQFLLQQQRKKDSCGISLFNDAKLKDFCARHMRDRPPGSRKSRSPVQLIGYLWHMDRRASEKVAQLVKALDELEAWTKARTPFDGPPKRPSPSHITVVRLNWNEPIFPSPEFEKLRKELCATVGESIPWADQRNPEYDRGTLVVRYHKSGIEIRKAVAWLSQRLSNLFGSWIDLQGFQKMTSGSSDLKNFLDSDKTIALIAWAQHMHWVVRKDKQMFVYDPHNNEKRVAGHCIREFMGKHCKPHGIKCVFKGATVVEQGGEGSCCAVALRRAILAALWSDGGDPVKLKGDDNRAKTAAVLVGMLARWEHKL